MSGAQILVSSKSDRQGPDFKEILYVYALLALYTAD
jgi:hypothetical protein